MKFVHDISRKHKLRKKQRISLLFAIVALGLFITITGLYELLSSHIIFKKSASVPQSSVLAETDETPDESPPDIKQSYVVPLNHPKSIAINSVGINGLIQKVGTDKRGKIVAPSNIHYAGWYVDAKIPGEAGLSIIDGHISGKFSDGIFKNLAAVKTDDIIAITYGDGHVKNFKVVKVVVVPEEKASATLFEKMPDTQSQLNLISCSGKYNMRTKTYDERVIVMSYPVI